MNVLLAYATNSSGTLVASQTVLNTAKAHGVEVIRKDIRSVNPDSLDSYDLILFGSPSWNYEKTEGMPHEFFLQFMKNMEGKTLESKPFAIFGLGDTAYMYFCGAVDHLEAFVQKLQGRLIYQSLRIDGFFFDQRNNEKKLEEWTTLVIEKLLFENGKHQTKTHLMQGDSA